MDVRLIREYRDRWRVVEAFELEEQRSATLDDRWRQLNGIIGLAIGLGLDLSADDSEFEVYRRWARIKKRAAGLHP
ncbi:MAG TPA: hypothetical protein VMN57_05895 [Anaerolineales bacterium]|nr:hypothetical protein [Anaerolineales bacterium]